MKRVTLMRLFEITVTSCAVAIVLVGTICLLKFLIVGNLL